MLVLVYIRTFYITVDICITIDESRKTRVVSNSHPRQRTRNIAYSRMQMNCRLRLLVVET